MCDPVSISAGIAIAGAVVGTIGQVQQQAYQAKAASYAADAAQNQAAAEEARQRDRARRVLGSQLAAYGGAGIDPNSGTALDVAADSAAQVELDALTIRHGGRVHADAYNAEAAGYRAAMPATILGGALNAASGYYDATKASAVGTASTKTSRYGSAGASPGSYLQNYNLDRLG
jgi:hypothetical protein